MIRPFNSEIVSLFNQLRIISGKGQQVFLVGGAVRDHLLGRPSNDLDFVVQTGTRRIASDIKKLLNGKMFMLDDARQTARVIIFHKALGKLKLDFVTFTGKNLEQDLNNRDFTINAIAIDLNDLSKPIDPCMGIDDIATRTIKCCSDHAVIDDPLRILRGARIAHELGFQIEDKTFQQMYEASNLLKIISSERIRDEIFRILDLGNSVNVLHDLDELNALEVILPELDEVKNMTDGLSDGQNLLNKTLKLVSYLEKILNSILWDHPITLQELPQSSVLISSLWQFRSRIKDHLLSSFQSDRSIKVLLLFAALFSFTKNISSSTTSIDRRIKIKGNFSITSLAIFQRATALALSNSEIEYLTTILLNKKRINDLLSFQPEISVHAIYHFFKDCGEAGIDICLITLAELFAIYENRLTRKQLEAHLKVLDQLFVSWWEKRFDLVYPPKLLDGEDLKIEFNLMPGPIFSEVLDALREAQVTVPIKTREHALIYIRNLLIQKKIIPKEFKEKI